MMRTMPKPKSRVFKYLLAVFLILSSVYFGVSLSVEYSKRQIQKQEILSRDTIFIQTIDTLIATRLSRVVSDLVYIRDSFRITADSGSEPGSFAQVQAQWMAFVNAKRQYDQIRYLNTNGDEVIRVNYTAQGPVITPADQLQNKKDRYYFADSIDMPENQIYVSCMDLNIENGQIQTPIKPMIRLSTPVFDRSGKQTGIIVLNYQGDNLLGLIKTMSMSSTGSIYMLNDDGYWLYNSADSSREWAFMYADRENDSFSYQYPDEWAAVRQNASGSLNTENGTFIYGRVFAADAYVVENSYPITMGSGDWFIVSQISPDSKEGQLVRLSLQPMILTMLREQYYVYLMILFISLVIALLMNIARTEQDSIRFFSEYDTMTGVLNRRAGLAVFHDRYVSNPDRRCHICICFVDVNGLKEVNDTLGHDAGDELICTVADVIKRTIRENDVVARLGGDEFLIVFENMDEESCEAVWKRIVEGYDTVNQTENRPYLISASHGIEPFQCSANQIIDSAINRADEKMYREKRVLKANLSVIRSAPQPTANNGDAGPRADAGAEEPTE